MFHLKQWQAVLLDYGYLTREAENNKLTMATNFSAHSLSNYVQNHFLKHANKKIKIKKNKNFLSHKYYDVHQASQIPMQWPSNRNGRSTYILIHHREY